MSLDHSSGRVVWPANCQRQSSKGVRRWYCIPRCAAAARATRGSVAAVRPFAQPFPTGASTHTHACEGRRLNVSPLSSKLATALSPTWRGPHVPVLDVPKTLAGIGEWRDPQTLHLAALRVEVVAEVQVHHRHLVRDRLKYRRVQLTARRLIERAPRGLEVPIDRQRRVAGEVVPGIAHLGRA